MTIGTLAKSLNNRKRDKKSSILKLTQQSTKSIFEQNEVTK